MRLLAVAIPAWWGLLALGATWVVQKLEDHYNGQNRA